jgi:hypothetical protein
MKIRWLVNNEQKECGRKRSLPDYIHYSRICLDGLRKTKKYLSQDSRNPGRGWNLALPDLQRWSMFLFWIYIRIMLCKSEGSGFYSRWGNLIFPDFFNWPNPSSRTMALGSTQPLTEMSTRNLPAGKGRPARKADNLTAIFQPIV